jgi:homopolymeric O-antigen transport system permease protein
MAGDSRLTGRPVLALIGDMPPADIPAPAPGLLAHRRYIWQGAVAELRHRYAGTGLGVVWNVVHPLALIAVYSIVFTTLMRGRLPGQEGNRFAYVLYLCSGLLPWLAFSECVLRGCNAFAENAIYLRKLPIPEPVFVARSVTAAALGLAISFGLLLLVAPALGLRPAWTWLLLPIPLAALMVMGYGVALLCATLNVFFRDVAQLLTIGLQVVLWTAPIVYVADVLPAWFVRLLPSHPLYPALVAVRDLFLRQTMPPLTIWTTLLQWPLIWLIVAQVTFNRLRPEIRDVL